jgi:hypothetical protein
MTTFSRTNKGREKKKKKEKKEAPLIKRKKKEKKEAPLLFTWRFLINLIAAPYQS